MRFVVGLCFGSLLVLAAAALLDWPGTQQKPATTASVGLDTIEPIVQEPTAAIPPPLAGPTSIETAVPDLEPVEPASATQWPSLAESITAPLPVSDTTMAPITTPVAEQPAVAMAEPREPHSDWIADDFSTAAISGSSTLESDSAEVAVEATATVNAEADAATEDYAATDGLPQVAVWRPFHSQMSAEGFAKRLSLQLGYPFSVVKVGAARYHVVFSYEDTAERDLLAEQLTALTGYSPK